MWILSKFSQKNSKETYLSHLGLQIFLHSTKKIPSDFVKILNFVQILTLKWPPNSQNLDFLL